MVLPSTLYLFYDTEFKLNGNCMKRGLEASLLLLHFSNSVVSDIAQEIPANNYTSKRFLSMKVSVLSQGKYLSYNW